MCELVGVNVGGVTSGLCRVNGLKHVEKRHKTVRHMGSMQYASGWWKW